MGQKVSFLLSLGTVKSLTPVRDTSDIDRVLALLGRLKLPGSDVDEEEHLRDTCNQGASSNASREEFEDK